MALTNIFANLSGNVAASKLDDNFTAVGAMAVTKCTATGTNIIALTQAANQPTIAAYANYLLFDFVAANTTNSAVTVNVNSIGAFPLYLPGGTVQATSEIISGGYYLIAYNSALNSNLGGFVIVSALPAAGATIIQNIITGYLPTAQTFTSNVISNMTITSGQAADSTNAVILAGGSFAWNITNGNAINGFQGGTTLPNSSTIHFYVCSGASGIGSFASTSLTPTLPAGYTTSYRRIFSLPTNSSGVLLAGTPLEISGGTMLYWLATQVLDINVSNLGAARTLYTLSVAAGIKVQPLIRFVANTNNSIIFTSPDETDVAPATNGTTVPLFDDGAPGGAFGTFVAYPFLTTNTSGQIGARASGASTNLAGVTRGWIDFRRTA